MKRYRLFHGKLREHDAGAWVRLEDVEAAVARLRDELLRIQECVGEKDYESIEEVLSVTP